MKTNLHLRVMYPLNLYLNHIKFDNNHPDKKIAKVLTNGQETGSGAGGGERDIGFDYKTLDELESDLVKLKDISFSKNIKLNLDKYLNKDLDTEDIFEGVSIAQALKICKLKQKPIAAKKFK